MCQKLYTADQTAMYRTLELIREETIRQAADMLHAAERVVCMGQGGSMLLAQDACHLFSTVSGKFSAVADSHTQIMTAVNMDEHDLILFFSFSGATKELIDTMQTARARGVKTLLVTRFLKSPGAALADLALPCGREREPAAARLHPGQDRPALPDRRAVFRVLPPGYGKLPAKPRAPRFGAGVQASVTGTFGRKWHKTFNIGTILQKMTDQPRTDPSFLLN